MGAVLYRAILGIAQQEYETLRGELASAQESIENWGGTSTRAVYYAFYTAVTATRAVRDRFEERLKGGLNHQLDEHSDLWGQLQRIRSEEAGRVFDDAGHLAGCYLHLFTPPYPNFSAKVVDGKVIYPVVDNINTNEKKDYPEILRDNFKLGRHASAVVDQYWESAASFIDRMVDVFYPANSLRSCNQEEAHRHEGGPSAVIPAS